MPSRRRLSLAAVTALAAGAAGALVAGVSGQPVAPDATAERKPPAAVKPAEPRPEQRPAERERSRERERSTPRRPSRSTGLPWAGRLHHGVQVPRGGATFFTWDPILKRSPNRPWRRWGSDRLVRRVLRVARAFAADHPQAPRIGIGDLSRPRGGDFGPRFGLPGHASHQNGLDADVYYPRLDGRERPPDRPGQIDRRLAQDLVDRFVRAGAERVFVGPATGLTGPPGVVQAIPHHDNHLHVRLPGG